MVVVRPKEPAAASVVRDGTYRAALTDIKKFTNSYGDRIGFEFTIQGGQFDGSKVMRSTAPQLTRQSKLAEVIKGIAGRPLTEKELAKGINLDQFIGTDCSILVLQSRSKAGAVYSNVEKVFQNQ
jgi:hypothetical protein